METKSPAVLWYTADFLTGTNLMTDEQLGKYTRALCYQHQQGPLSEEDMLMICKTYDDKIFSKFIQNKEGKYYNKRMALEIDKRNNYVKSRSSNRKGKPNKTKEKSKSHMKNISSSYEKHMENENDNENKDINISNLEDRGMGEETFIEINIYEKVISKLNELTGSKFNYKTKSTQEFINGRLNDGYTVEDLIMVVEKMCRLWGNPKKGEKDMSEYLQPSTLFRPTNFENYFNKPIPKTKQTTKDLKLDMSIMND